jgi:hypothetical protein
MIMSLLPIVSKTFFGESFVTFFAHRFPQVIRLALLPMPGLRLV